MRFWRNTVVDFGRNYLAVLLRYYFEAILEQLCKNIEQKDFWLESDKDLGKWVFEAVNTFCIST